ncbi:uncharacterized protein LOC112086213 [Eutrema salsugineum]|nr:uncharacterized protein LOC112086213 [Eutrema salsugineum]
MEKRQGDMRVKVGNKNTSDYKVLGRRDLFLDPSVRLKATHGLI